MSWAKRLFGRTEQKSAQGAFRPWAAGVDGGAQAPLSYEGQVRAAMRNPVALRAIRLVAEGFASVTLEAGEDAHPALELLTPDLLEGVATHLLLHGNAFLETGLNYGGQPGALWLLRPERMRLETDANGWPKNWVYQVGTQVQRLPAEGDSLNPALLHLKALNPLDDHMVFGDFVSLDFRRKWKIQEKEIRGLKVHFKARAFSELRSTLSDAYSGRSSRNPHIWAGLTDLAILKPPSALVEGQLGPWVWLGGGDDWQGAKVTLFDGVDSKPVGSVSRNSFKGTLAAPFGTGSAEEWDDFNVIRLDASNNVGLHTITDAQVLAGGNILWIGDELIQFRDVEVGNQGELVLSRLRRGCFDTLPQEHLEIGALVRQISPAFLIDLEIPQRQRGVEMCIVAIGISDPPEGQSLSFVP